MTTNTVAPPSRVQDDFLKVEPVGIEAIPESERHTRPWELFGTWAGAFMNYTTILTGSLCVTFGLGIVDGALAIIVGTVLGCLVLGLLSVSGPRGGVPQIVFSRLDFGYRGAYLAGALTIFLAIGWFAVDCVIASQALEEMLGKLGVGTSRGLEALLLLLVVAVSIVVAVYGYRTLMIFERYGAATFLLFSVVLLVAMAPKIHWHLTATVHGGAHLAAWVLGASVVFALIASWFTFAADYSRYLPERTSVASVAGWVGVGVGLPMIGLGILGTLFLSLSPTSDDLLHVITGATSLPLAVAFLLFVALGMIWANYFDVYTAGLAALALDIKLQRWQSALLCGIVGGALAYYALFVSNFLTAYQNFLLVTYLWTPAWAAVVLLDLFVFRARRYDPASFFRRTFVRWPALIALIAGTLAAIPFINSTLWQGPLSTNVLGGTDISGFVSFLVGAAVFAGLHFLQGDT